MPSRKRPGLSAQTASDRAADAGDPPRRVAPVDGEHRILAGCSRHDILDRLRSTSSERPSRFRTELASVVNLLQVRLADAFYSSLQGATQFILLSQHSHTAEMLELCRALCSDISVLRAWNFKDDSEQLQVDTRLQPVCGHGRVFNLRVAPVILLDEPLGEICNAPFLLSILFILISEQFGLFSLTLMFARASQGRWDVSDGVSFRSTSSQTYPPWSLKQERSEASETSQ